MNSIQSSSGPIKDAIQRNKTRIGAELIKYKIKKGVSSNKELQIGGGVGGQQKIRGFSPTIWKMLTFKPRFRKPQTKSLAMPA